MHGVRLKLDFSLGVRLELDIRMGAGGMELVFRMGPGRGIRKEVVDNVGR